VKLNDEDGTEPPCERCYVELNEANVEAWKIYSLCRNQIRVAPMGEVIGLDYGAVLNVIELYTDNVKKTFEQVLACYRLEEELKNEFHDG